MEPVSLANAMLPERLLNWRLLSVFHFDHSAGVSLHLVPDLPHISVDSGSDATLQCILNGDSQVTRGSFSWTFRQGEPLRTTEDGHVTISDSVSGTVSTLTINRVNRSDEAEYSCSYTSLDTVSITMDVVCK